eukprot:gene10451-biopygen5249
MSNDDLLGRRKNVLMAPLRESPGLGEVRRLFRTRLYSYLQTLHLEKAVISNNMTSLEFDEGMETSLFCLILPGDTPGTAKLYKAIFRAPPARFNDLMSNDDLLGRRKNVLMAPLRESPGLGEVRRLFRTRLYSYLQTLHLEKAVISNNMTSLEFDEGMETSLFCLILPGDTPGTAKLYKAIFRAPPARFNDLMSNDDLLGRRKHVLMAPLRESPGLFRTPLYSYLQTLHLEKAVISNNMTSAEFDEGMETSLFCLILPSDTPSTSKLYKAIFRALVYITPR